jgi:dUTP pyrophosphatase
MKSKQIFKVCKLVSHAKTPQRASQGAAGYDLFASESIVIPGARATKNRVFIGRGLVSTGISIEVPRNSVGRIGSRSGLSVKHNIEVGAGWIDSDYRGEVKVELKNLGQSPFAIKRGMRIAQLILLKIHNISPKTVNKLTHSKRGHQGFGSSGSE